MRSVWQASVSAHILHAGCSNSPGQEHGHRLVAVLQHSYRVLNLPAYPYSLDLNYGRSDYNVGKAFKLFGVWQPVDLRGDRAG